MRPKDSCGVDFTVIGARYREERDRNNITREQLAEKTGYCVKHIQEIENGRQMPEADFTIACCKLYHRDMNFFFPETIRESQEEDAGKVLTSMIQTMSRDGINDTKRFISYLEGLLGKFD